MSPRPFSIARINAACLTIRNAEGWLINRAADAGLQCSISIDGWMGRTDREMRFAIRLSTHRATFKRGNRRAVSYASAYSLDDFDAIVADAVKYLKRKDRG